MFTINKNISINKTEWVIKFDFKKQIAIILCTLYNGSTDLRLVSQTDGYHWLEFWLSQEPKEDELRFNNNTDEDYKNSKKQTALLFKNNGFIFRSEDKESCYLNCANITDATIEKIAQFIEPRFALRELFFE